MYFHLLCGPSDLKINASCAELTVEPNRINVIMVIRNLPMDGNRC